MEELALTDELRTNIVNWMMPKYALGTIRNRRTFLKSLFKDYKVLNQENLRKIMKSIKYQQQRACLVMINDYCYENNISFSLRIPSIKKQAQKLPEILSPEEIKLMVQSAPHPYNLAIRCIFNMGAGLRVSEVIKLSWDHIRWVDWVNDKDSYGIATIKSGKGSKDRIVNIPPKLMQDLYEYAKEEHVLNEFGIPVGAMIFPFGSRVLPINIPADQIDRWKQDYVEDKYKWFLYHIIQKCCEKALNKHIKIHSLRHCVSEDTEILTLNGWKSYRDLIIGEPIFSYNLNKDVIELDNIQKINSYNYDGILEKIENRYIDEFITPEHKIVIKEITKNYNPSNYKLKSYTDLNKKTWNISHKLSAKLSNNIQKIGRFKAGILGFILSDGHISNRKEPSISISQSYTSNKDKCKYIDYLFKKSKLKYTKKIHANKKNGFSSKEYTMIEWTILKGGNGSKFNLGDKHNWIYEYLNKDRTPKLNKILELSYLEIKELYNCIMLGDGTRKNYNSREYCGQNKERIELVRILCILLGHRTSQSYKKNKDKIYSRVFISENKDYTQITKQKKHFYRKYYLGIVWCPETNNSTFIARRNNKIFITGNSRATYLYEVEGLPVEKIQVLLGHNSLNTTMLYTRVNPKSVFELLKNTKEI
jgi:integrase